MAVGAQGGRRFLQHMRLGTAVRVVAGGAFILGRLMLEFGGGQEIVVAREADLLLGAFETHRKA
jgi:hypothetical protein